MKKSPGHRANANQSLTRLSLPSIIPDNNPVSPKDGSHKNLMQFKTYITALAVFCSTAGASYSQEIQRDCQSSQNSYRVVYVNNDIEKDSIIELTSLRSALKTSADTPVDSIYDPFIAAGRQAAIKLEKGMQLRFSHCFSKSHLLLSERINKLQDRFSLQKAECLSNPARKLGILKVRRSIKTGATIEISDLKIEQIEEQKAPAQSIGDIWIVLGRQTLRPLRKGEKIEYQDVVPRFKEIFYGSDL